jgi:hypothetical protein
MVWMRRPRISWLVLIAAVVTVAAVPALREQARAIPPSVVGGLWPEGFFWSPSAVREAAAFVDRHYPNDPDMLLAVATLALNTEANWSPDEPEREQLVRLRRSFLQRAVAEGGTPAAWAAYTELLEVRVIRPGDQEEVRPEPGIPAGSGAAPAPDPASPVSDLGPPDDTLADIRAWRAVDPENALPMALEALKLYGLDKEDQARSLWLAASTKPILSDRWTERTEALSLLWQRMGCPEMESRASAAYVDSSSLRFSLYGLSPPARDGSRAGIEAASQGRTQEAVRLWQATIDLGRHMQMSADTSGEFQTGVSLEQVGADPIWQLHPRYHYGMSNEEERRRSFWYGSHHALYVEQMGEEADAALRDRLVRNRARFFLLAGPFAADTELSDMQAEAEASLAHFVSLALSTGLLLVLFAIVSLYGRQAADRAADIGLGWRTALVLAPLPLGYLLLLLLDVEPSDPWLGARTAGPLWVHAAAIPFAVLALSLGSIMYRHPGSAGMWAVWRGNMRAVLPSVAALVAVYCVVLGLDAAPLRARVTEELRRPKLARVIEELGDRWHDPPIPRDAWRAEHPPEEAAEDRTQPPL